MTSTCGHGPLDGCRCGEESAAALRARVEALTQQVERERAAINADASAREQELLEQVSKLESEQATRQP